jgi:hypothetical protein
MRIEPRTNLKPARVARVISGAALLGVVSVFVFAIGLALAADQTPAARPAKGFKSALDFFPPPDDRQMRSYLEGTESEMGPNGTIILHNAELQTFNKDGTREMIMNAPQCLYDYNSHAVHSDGPLKLQMWEEKNKRAFQLQGSNGFYWQQTNSVLIVSNGQKTTISGGLTNSF